MPHSADRATAAARDAYRGQRELMLENRKRKADSREDLRGKSLAPRCRLTGDLVEPRRLALEGNIFADPNETAKVPVLPKSIFNEIQVGTFGAVWSESCRPHLQTIVDLLKDLFTKVDVALPTITCHLALDHEVSPKDNSGVKNICDLQTPLNSSRLWETFVRRLRTDHAYRDLVGSLAARLFGMRLTFHTCALVPFEVYTWKWPFHFSIAASSFGATMQTMSFVPNTLLDAVGSRERHT